MPRPADSAPCGSRSTSSTRRPYSASAAPRLMVEVVLPTPPFWLHRASTVAGPWLVNGCGFGSRPRIAPSAGDDEPATVSSTGFRGLSTDFRGSTTDRAGSGSPSVPGSIGGRSSLVPPAVAIHTASSGSLIDPGTPSPHHVVIPTI